LRLAGRGRIHGNPVTIQARGAPLGGDAGEKPWPFSAVIEGAAVGMRAAGTMERPLDARHLDARVKAHGDNLELVDAIIEAGLPGTQPVAVDAIVRREGRDWTIKKL